MENDVPRDIPLALLRTINPNVDISKTVLYTFNDNDIVEKIDDRTFTYYFPYSQNTYWTHFKYLYAGVNGYVSSNVHIEINVRTMDNTKYDLITYNNCVQNKWNSMKWHIPSQKHQKPYGVYFTVKMPYQYPKYGFKFSISIVGLIDLYPSVPTYILQCNQQYDIVFFKHENHILLLSMKKWIDYLMANNIKHETNYSRLKFCEDIVFIT